MELQVKYIGKIQGGLNTRYSPTNIADDEFASLRNLISWHGSLYSKAGTQPVGILSTPLSDSASLTLDSTGGITFSVISVANNSTNNLQLPATSTLAPSTITITDGANTWSEPSAPNGDLLVGSSVLGSVQYNSTQITLTGGVPNATLTISAQLYAGLPVVGMASLVSSQILLGTLSVQQLVFDTQRAYLFLNNAPASTQNLLAGSFFQATNNLCLWHGQPYELFQTATLAQAIFVSNQTPCMQLGAITNISVTSNVVTMTTTTPPAIGEVLWLNEIPTVTGLNGATVTVTASTPTSFSFVFTTPDTSVASTGIFQRLTASPTTTGDGLRYYYKNSSGTYGFVNYAPPESAYSATNLPYYICGCKTLLYYGSRLCLFGVWKATSAQALAGQYTFFPNSMSYGSFVGSEVGSPFYTDLNPVGAIYVNPGAFYITPPAQYGGNILFPSTTGISAAVVWKLQYAIVAFYSGSTYRLETSVNALFPYKITQLSPQFGCSGTNALIPLSEMVVMLSKQGIVGTDATSADRIDFAVPDQVGSISIKNNALSRVVTYVDNTLEAVFFTFPSDQASSTSSPYPDTTLWFNYRENTWAILDEHFTFYGSLIYTTNSGHTWASLTKPWSAYTVPWTPQTKGDITNINACGNQQGFLFNRSMTLAGSGNSPSLNIYSIVATTNGYILTVNNHNISPNANQKQYIYISGCLGTIGSFLNGKNFVVSSVISITQFTIQADPQTSFTYLGLGQITLVDYVQVQTKAFQTPTNSFKALKILIMALFVARQSRGAIALYPYCNTNFYEPMNKEQGTYVPVYPSTNLELREYYPEGINPEGLGQQYIWKQVPVNVTAQSVSFVLKKSDEQMLDPLNNDLSLEINGIAFEYSSSGNLFSY